MKNTIIILLAIGCLAACQNAPSGAKAKTAAAKEVKKPVAAAAETKTYNITPGSSIGWSGKKLAGEHRGKINVSNGTVTVADYKVTGGKFTIDMNSLACLDLAAGEGKEKLEGHLKSADFFNTEKFPTSQFEITKIAGNQVTGNLTILGVTKSITFPANINVGDDNVMVTSPVFTINRTDWGLKYGSASFVDVVKDKAINDNISLSLRLRAS